MLITWAGLKSSVVVLHFQAAPGAQKGLSLTAGLHCSLRAEREDASRGLEQARKAPPVV